MNINDIVKTLNDLDIDIDKLSKPFDGTLSEEYVKEQSEIVDEIMNMQIDLEESNSEKRELIIIAMLLEKARVRAEQLPCLCEEFATCGKHKIVDDITNIEKNIRDTLITV